MKTYKIYRGYSQVFCDVLTEREKYSLKHLMYHSPDGFEFGYYGSGPSDLARSIIGDHMKTNKPESHIYQAFKADFIACEERDSFEITERDIERWLVRNDLNE